MCTFGEGGCRYTWSVTKNWEWEWVHYGPYWLFYQVDRCVPSGESHCSNSGRCDDGTICVKVWNPSKINSVQGREFESKSIAELCKLLRIKKTTTTPYNPKCDGLVERFNPTVKQILTTLVADTKSDWDNHLSYVMMAYRSTMQQSTKCTPNLVILNCEVTIPLDLILELLMTGTSPFVR